MPEKNVAFPGRLQMTARLMRGTRPSIRPEQDLGLDTCTANTNTVSAAQPASEHLLALRKLLQSHDYHLALVRHTECSNLSRSEAEPFSIAPAAVLLPVTWKDFVLEAPASAILEESSLTRFGQVCIDFRRMEVTRAGELVALTAQEFKILKCLVSQPHRVLSRDELLNQAWGYDSYPTTRTVDNHVLKLRQKLEKDPARPLHFRTIHKFGYKFVPQAEHDCQSLTRLRHSQQNRIQTPAKRIV